MHITFFWQFIFGQKVYLMVKLYMGYVIHIDIYQFLSIHYFMSYVALAAFTEKGVPYFQKNTN